MIDKQTIVDRLIQSVQNGALSEKDRHDALWLLYANNWTLKGAMLRVDFRARLLKVLPELDD